MQGQSITTEAFRVGGLADFLYTQDIAFEMRPAELAFALVVFQVTGAPVAAEDSGEYVTQQVDQYFGSACDSDSIKDEVRRHQSPEPALFSAGPVSGFIAVDDRLMGQLPFQFRTGLSHCLAGFLPTVLNAAQTEWYCQNLFQQLSHHAPRHAANHRQISNERSQLWPEMALHFPGQFRLRWFATFRTDDTLASIFRDMCFDGRQFGHLMPPRLALCGHPARQAAVAMAALRRKHLDHLIDTAQRRQPAPVATMTGLASRLAPALLSSATPRSLLTG